ncbi:hypothetical protein [Allokutzneria sp. NRRL B-24872]|uniref:hypothetical protein n=1 Tax=Allokutzneria sp. NRRL B-24872 TaxID=1137961 RepID=UPI000A3A2225|nr:hypothetical protein [Allokutzneria sp. NRRL B-24872]
MTSENELLERSLRHAVTDVDAPPGFTDRVLVGGRRRRFRRRAGMATAAAAVTVLVGGLAASTPTWLAGPDSTTPADSRMSEPTRGDLAKDAAFLDKVLDRWRSEALATLSRAGDRGEDCWAFTKPAHVYWAGTTPAGPAALVIQPSVTTPETCPMIVQGSPTWLGLVANGREDGATHVLKMVAGGASSTSPEVFAFGPGAATLIATEASGAKVVSPRVEVGPDGKKSRRVQPLEFRDGVAVHQMEAGTYVEREFAVSSEVPDEQGRTTKRSLWITDATHDHFTRRPQLDWPHLRGDLGGSALDDPGRRRLIWNALQQSGMTDPFSPNIDGGDSGGNWMIFAALPDGRTVAVTERFGDSASRLYAILLPGSREAQEKLVRGEKVPHTVVYGGKNDVRAGYVKLRLPDQQGWIVASYRASLKYRIGEQDWVSVQGDAALLPASATHVEITKPGAGGQNDVMTIPLT